MAQYSTSVLDSCQNLTHKDDNDINCTLVEICENNNISVMSGYSNSCLIENKETSQTNPFIMVWYLQLIHIVAFVSMVIVAAGGNAIVIWIVLAHKRMRTVTNYFLVNLAVADFLISVLNTLFNFVYMLHGNDWPFGRTYCKVSQFISTCTISVSVLTFMAIAIDRYIAIIHPLKPRLSAVTVTCVIVVIWIVSLAVAFPNLLFATTYTWELAGGKTRTVCYLLWPDGAFNITDLIYNIFLMLVNYLVPLAALAGTYARVGIELWGSQAIGEVTAKQEESIQSKRKVVKMMIMIVVIFGVCWLPQHLFFIVTSIFQEINDWPHMQHIYLVIFWIAMSNSMYNPIIYCWMNARFRRGFMYVFRWLPCVKMTAPAKKTILNPRGVGTTEGNLGRTSMSEASKYNYDRNGSVNTQIDSMDESTYVSTHQAQPRYQYRGFTRVRTQDDDYLENRIPMSQVNRSHGGVAIGSKLKVMEL